MNTARSREWFTRLPRSLVPRYKAFWRRLAPLSEDDVLRRWLFAFCSVHTSWQGNVRGYNAVRDLGWLGDRDELVRRLTGSRTGMHNMKANFIWAFAEKFRANPAAFRGSVAEERDVLVESITGLGHAKVSFALNMIQPIESRVVCLDVHMLRLYGLEKIDYKSAQGLRAYRRAEADWIARSESHPPYITQSIYWDRLHGEVMPGYWANCL